MPRGATARALAVNIVAASDTTALAGIPAAQGSSTACLDQTIQGVVNFTAGTAATAVTVRCRTSGGTQFGTSQVVTIAAGNSANIPFMFSDVSGLATNTYTISLQQTAATGNGTANEIVAYASGEA